MAAAEFFAVYQPYWAIQSNPGHSSTLWGAIANDDPSARVAISNRLLDDGADPAFADGEGVNLIHILLNKHEHDFVAEAPLLRRLLDGGADINQYGRKLGPPLMVLTTSPYMRDDELDPFYDVIYSRPDIDFTVRADAATPPRSLRSRVERAHRLHPEMVRRMHDYEKNGPTPALVL